jgi:hypothetical protein
MVDLRGEFRRQAFYSAMRGAREIVGGATEGRMVGPAEDGGGSSIPLDMKEMGANAFLASSSKTPAAGENGICLLEETDAVPGADDLMLPLCCHFVVSINIKNANFSDHKGTMIIATISR